MDKCASTAETSTQFITKKLRQSVKSVHTTGKKILLGRQSVLNQYKSDEYQTLQTFLENNEWSIKLNNAFIDEVINAITNDEGEVYLLLSESPDGYKESDFQIQEKAYEIPDKTLNIFWKNLVAKSVSTSITNYLCSQCCVLVIELQQIINHVAIQIEAAAVAQPFYLFKISKLRNDVDETDLTKNFKRMITSFYTSSTQAGGSTSKTKKLILGRWRNIYMVKVADAGKKKIPMANYKGQLTPVSYLKALEKKNKM